MEVRNMLPGDLPDVLRIQSECYTEIEPESPQSLAAKFQASPKTCFVALSDKEVMAYLISVPSDFGKLPELDSKTCTLPEKPACLYLHDLAVSKRIRGGGFGRVLVEKFLELVTGYRGGSLIAVQNSVLFWQKFGFSPGNNQEAFKEKLSLYGEGATYMEMRR